ncbi:hypothetical protein H4683_003656, partial [Filibacter limicola]|nr:hypothetical protein [Sporosarcina limicola]
RLDRQWKKMIAHFFLLALSKKDIFQSFVNVNFESEDSIVFVPPAEPVSQTVFR